MVESLPLPSRPQMGGPLLSLPRKEEGPSLGANVPGRAGASGFSSIQWVFLGDSDHHGVQSSSHGALSTAVENSDRALAAVLSTRRWPRSQV